MTLRRQGLSLLEAVIAIFFLAAAMLVLIGVFQAAANYTARANTRQLALLVAEKNLEALRAAARQCTGSIYGYDTWATNPPLSTPTADADMPQYSVQARMSYINLYSPCSTTELALHGSDPRVLTSSLYKVKLTVTWGSTDSTSLMTYIGDPLRVPPTASPAQPFPTLSISSVGSPPNPLLRNAVLGYQVSAVDAGGNSVHDLLTDWFVAAGTGNGSLSQNRRGTLCNATNVLVLPSQPSVFTGGNLTIIARARLWGYEQTGVSAGVYLQP